MSPPGPNAWTRPDVRMRGPAPTPAPAFRGRDPEGDEAECEDTRAAPSTRERTVAARFSACDQNGIFTRIWPVWEVPAPSLRAVP